MFVRGKCGTKCPSCGQPINSPLPSRSSAKAEAKQQRCNKAFRCGGRRTNKQNNDNKQQTTTAATTRVLVAQCIQFSPSCVSLHWFEIATEKNYRSTSFQSAKRSNRNKNWEASSSLLSTFYFLGDHQPTQLRMRTKERLHSFLLFIDWLIVLYCTKRNAERWCYTAEKPIQFTGQKQRSFALVRLIVSRAD